SVLTAAGTGMVDVIRFQTFLTHASDIDGFMEARAEVFPRYFPDGVFPPNTLLVVARLVKPELLVEIEAMAIKPAGASPRGAKAARRAAKPSRATRRRWALGEEGSRGEGKDSAGTGP